MPSMQFYNGGLYMNSEYHAHKNLKQIEMTCIYTYKGEKSHA